MAPARVFGVDFTSAPRRAKPIMIAAGRLAGDSLAIEGLQALPSFADFDRWLVAPGPWLAAFDFPFGLPRELVEALDWPHRAADGESAWARLVRHLDALPRERMIATFRAWCAARPAGSKFSHRATDRPAGSSPSMKWVNPPVALMLQAGAPRLLAAGVDVPGMQPGDPWRVALEGYPGWLARALVGRVSYKSDLARGRTAEREQARRDIVAGLEAGKGLGIPVTIPAALRDACVGDPRGDSLDAVLCAVQAAWAQLRRDSGYGLPAGFDPVEGWIVGVPAAAAAQV